MLRRRRRAGLGPLGLKLFIGLAAAVLGWMTWYNAAALFKADEDPEALQLVKKFYAFEQEGDFGSSWELFHPLMETYFNKSSYIQRRAHITMQHFEVKTFQYRVSEPKHIVNWRMNKEAKPFSEAYEIIVTQAFQTPFGNFELVQPCYAVLESGEWRMLWSYEKNENKDEKS